MRIITILFGYLKWHYGQALFSLSGVWKNFLYFCANYFSIKLLFKNFFDPWKRMTDTYPSLFDFKKYVYALITNTIVRVVGIIMRTFLLLLGLICYLFLLVLYPVALCLWLLLPFIIIYLIVYGLLLLVTF